MNPAVLAMFIPITAIVLGIGIGALSVWTEHKRKAQLLEQLHKERIIALEKGLPPPDIANGLVGFLNSKPKAALTPEFLWPRAVRNGLALLLIGLVTYFAIMRAGGDEGAMFALIPAAIGLANLVYAGVIWKQAKDSPRRAD